MQAGLVNNLQTAGEFVRNFLQNMPYNDAAFLSLGWDAVAEKDFDKLVCLHDECTAVKLPLELRQASWKLGLRLHKIAAGFSKAHAADEYEKRVAAGLKPHYCTPCSTSACTRAYTRHESF